MQHSDTKKLSSPGAGANAEQELLARIHDTVSNGLAALHLPLPDSIHKSGLAGVVEQVWEMTRAAWESETGERSEKP